MTSTSNQPVREAAAEELGPEAASQIPEMQRPAPFPPDPGASALVAAMLNGMTDRIVGEESVTRIGLGQIRNQSRCSAEEFHRFCDRLAALLNKAGRDSRVEFTCDPDADVQYQVQGTAYIISADGFDLWELFLSLTPAERNWTVWQADGPVRVLRHPRPAQQQIFMTQ